MQLRQILGFLGLILGLGCVTQPAFTHLSTRLGDPPPIDFDSPWWEGFNDPGLNALIHASFQNNPTLEVAVAQIDEARAQLGFSSSDRYPALGATTGITQSHEGNGSPKNYTIAEIGPTVSWEIDLYGRIRNSIQVATSRLNAKTAEAQNARMLLAAQVSTLVFDHRAAVANRDILASNVRSRMESLNLLQTQVNAGFTARIEVDSAKRDLANVAVEFSLAKEQSTKTANALAVLCGLSVNEVDGILGQSEMCNDVIGTPDYPVPKEIEATALINNPAVRAAEFEAEAAWSEIAVARAERWPRFNLLGFLTGQWIRAAGSTLDFSNWSLGGSVTGFLFDAGRGKANVAAAEARYRRALAELQNKLNTAVLEAQNAMATLHSANERLESALIALDSGRASFQGNEILWRNGSISLLDLEDSRRQLLMSQFNNISATHDRATAWIVLQRVLGVPTNSQKAF